MEPGPGALVVEVGIRQAWLFLTLCDTATAGETRLLLDTGWTLGPDRFDLDADDLEAGLVLLCRLLNRTLENTREREDGGLVLDFGAHGRLEISGAGAASTTHDVWWLSR
ncbi:hypothetical protein [Actinoplanes sp. NPDC051494]|uniref:hypothetical protein n=1 Tax=Actinoplanes sp. NPDC051494 TaxID=3363907 RepID=UPI0037AB2D71